MKPILFNTDDVRAILDGRKSVTRRVVKSAPLDMCYEDGSPARNTPYQPGDILYVRETWARIDEDIDSIFFENPELIPRGQIIYREQYMEEGLPECKWRPSIHMPKEAARIFLRVTDVRVERLQDITDDQAEKEGCGDYSSTALGFFDVWDSAIKKADLLRYGWDANPWVFVIEFKRISKEAALQKEKS